METYKFTEEQLRKFARGAMELYEEYQINHDQSADEASISAENEMLQGLKEERYLVDIGEEKAHFQIYPEGGSE